jgi:hypothetical protein
MSSARSFKADRTAPMSMTIGMAATKLLSKLSLAKRLGRADAFETDREFMV